MKIKVQNIGLTSYSEALEIQMKIHENVSSGASENVLILCEHPHVYTFGKSADKNNLLINPDFLKKINAEVFETDRGGDITYHGPGQLVGYPIINLRKIGMGVKKYVELLEQALIDALAEFHIVAYQIPGLVGIWVGEEQQVKRKIGAIGIRIKNGVSMHGFALNVTTDLSYFDYIVPCGITDKGVTSIENETGKNEMQNYVEIFCAHFEKLMTEATNSLRSIP